SPCGRGHRLTINKLSWVRGCELPLTQFVLLNYGGALSREGRGRINYRYDSRPTEQGRPASRCSRLDAANDALGLPRAGPDIEHVLDQELLSAHIELEIAGAEPQEPVQEQVVGQFLDAHAERVQRVREASKAMRRHLAMGKFPICEARYHE